LLLDSHYASIPFKIDYQEIMQMFHNEFDINILTNNNSTFQRSLKQISDLLQNTLYLSPEMLLHKRKVILELDVSIASDLYQPCGSLYQRLRRILPPFAEQFTIHNKTSCILNGHADDLSV